MGYYTFHTLNVYDKDKKAITDVDDMYYLIIRRMYKDISTYGDALFEEEVKWYEEEDNSLIVSSAFPDYYIEIIQDGEGSDDYGSKLYHGGKKVAEWILDFSTPDIDELLTKFKVKS